MFLSPSPPRITRRSRIEHWLLLLLRAAAICLLALAFARPFLRETAVLMGDSGPGKRVAIVVDTSASMQRDDLWRQAVDRASSTIRAAGPMEQISLYAFDEELRLLVDWQEPLSESSSREARLLGALGELRPGWGRSVLGTALVKVAEQIAGDRAEQDAHRDAEIVLISDCQQGSDTSALRGYPWPEEVLLRIEKVTPKVADNASLRLLASDEPGVWRARVANAADSSSEQFLVSWGNVGSGKTEDGVSVYVPPGQSRIVRMPEPPPSVDRIRLEGDAAPFDNEFFLAQPKQREGERNISELNS